MVCLYSERLKERIYINKVQRMVGLSVLLLWMLLSGVQPLSAQNNPWKINDKLVPLMKVAEDSVMSLRGMEYIERFRKEAICCNDVKAQCMTYSLYAKYYSKRKDEAGMRKNLQEAKSFVLKTPYDQYYFQPWSFLATYYAYQDRSSDLYRELKWMLEEAGQRNSKYGMVAAYQLLATYYKRLNNLKQALWMYEQMERLIDENYKLGSSMFCFNYAACLYNDGQNEKAVAVLKKAEKYPLSEYLKCRLHLALMVYCIFKNGTTSPELYKKNAALIARHAALADSIIQGDTLLMERLRDSYYAIVPTYYNYIEQNPQKAHDLQRKSKNKTAESYYNMSEYSAFLQRYDTAYAEAKTAFDLYWKRLVSMEESKKDNTVPLQNRLDSLLRDHNRLLLTNSQLELEQAREEERIQELEMRNKRNLLALSDSLIAHQEDSLQRQQENLEQARRELLQVETLDNLNRQRRMWYAAFMALALLLLFLTAFYLIWRQLRLAKARRRAIRHNKNKGEFLHNMSHDIRTPLNAVVGFTELLNGETREELGEAEIAEMQHTITTNAELLSSMVNNLLDASKIESGTYKPSLTQMDADELCGAAVAAVEPHLPEGLLLNWQPQSMRQPVTTDAARALQLLTNLLLVMADRYTTQGPIELRCETVQPASPRHPHTEACLRFTLSNHGTDMKPEERETCFDRMRKTGETDNGIGLQLHLCRLIAKMLHGRVYADSGYTEGLRFVFEHPLNLSDQPQDTPQAKCRKGKAGLPLLVICVVFPCLVSFYGTDSDHLSSYQENRRRAEALYEKGEVKQAYEAMHSACDELCARIEELQAKEREALHLQEQLDNQLFEQERLQMRYNELQQERILKHRQLLAQEERSKEDELQQNRILQQRQQEDLKQQQMLLQRHRKEVEHSKEMERLNRMGAVWRIAFFALLVLILSGCIVYMKLREKRLIADRKKAEHDEQLKSMFLQNMNHDIRSPLNAIKGFTELLNGECRSMLSAEEIDEMKRMIAINAELLGTLINDVLDLTTLESATYRVVLKEVDTHDLCKAVLESVRSRVQEGVEIRYESATDKKLLVTDSSRLQQVLTNFLTNACKYTPTGSIVLKREEVTLPAADGLPAGTYIRFSVSDTGPGVHGEDALTCFNRFTMLDKSVKGTGLGLHICKLTSRLLHGRVYVDTAYTEGARFVFDHPIVS